MSVYYILINRSKGEMIRFSKVCDGPRASQILGSDLALRVLAVYMIANARDQITMITDGGHEIGWAGINEDDGWKYKDVSLVYLEMAMNN